MSKKRRTRQSTDTKRKRKAILLHLQECRCFWCQTELQYETATFDEVMPYARGGRQTLGNVVLACRPCNEKRGKTMPTAAARERAAVLGSALGAAMLAARDARRAAAYIEAWEATRAPAPSATLD